MNKEQYRRVCLAALGFLLAVIVAMPLYAFANANGNGAESEIGVTESATTLIEDETAADAEAENPESTGESEPTGGAVAPPLTPDGNLSLVDDATASEISDKQFITAVTKSGNYFYLVIDRAKNGENVYFLNMVDESDLLSLIEAEGGAMPTPGATTEEMPKPQEQPAEEQEEPPEKDSGAGGMIAGLVVIALIGGGALYYFKAYRPKKAKAVGNGIAEFEGFGDYDFDDEEDGFSVEDESKPAEETDDENIQVDGEAIDIPADEEAGEPAEDKEETE